MWNMGRHRGIWSLLLLLLCTLTSQQPCPNGDYLSEKGICCNKCSAGFKLVKECQAKGLRSNCTGCPKNQYTDQLNYAPNCRSCRSCKDSDNKEVVSKCEAHKNTVCRCKPGYYRDDINSETFQCLKCRTCGPEEMEKHTCTQENNTQCVCKANYYRVKTTDNKRKCELCQTCSAECDHLCTKTTPTTPKTTRGIDPTKSPFLYVTTVFVVFALVLVIVITYVTTKRSTKKRMLKRSSECRSPDSCKVLIVDEDPLSDHIDQAVPQMPQNEQEQFSLPDCVPLEINIPDLIYAVLDLVPVQQMKQLVRTLGVRDTEIEQAEMDHRSCREAHYQMLRVWAERGSHAGKKGRDRIMYRPLLEELLAQLRKIHLGRAAEELESKYGIV